MASQPAILDCLVIGHNELSAGERVSAMEPFKGYSGGYGDVVRNYVFFRGEWHSYIDLFNYARRKADGGHTDVDAWGATNLAACYLTSYLRRRSFDVRFCNSFRGDKDRLRELLEAGVRAVAVTTTYYLVKEEVAEVVDTVRAIAPDTRIIVGGPFIHRHATKSRNPAALLKQLGADIYVVENQGEATLAAVLHAIRKDPEADLTGIPNLMLLGDDGFVQTGKVGEDNSLDDETVRWDEFDADFVRPMALTRTARSCAFSCAFCTYPVFGGSLVTADVTAVGAELRRLESQGVRFVDFVDDTFNVPLPRFKKLCRMMIENEFSFRWISFLRVGNMDDEAFDLAAESGCVGALLGLESTDDSVLRNMNKRVTVEKYRAGIQKLHDRGILTQAMFVVGYPGETEETVRGAIDFVRETRPDFCMVQLWYYDVLAPVASRAEEFGLEGFGFLWKHATMSWSEADGWTDHFLQNLSDSIFLPGYGFGFENIFYLLGLGYDRETLKRFLGVAHGMLARSVREEFDAVAAMEPELIASVSGALAGAAAGARPSR